jgi:curved DNA-binding protein CbpA
MKFREDELKERARNLLGINNKADEKQIQKAYRKKVKEIHPDITKNNDKIMGLISQAYALLKGRNRPLSLLESDNLVSSIINNPITPINQTFTYEQWQREQFYSDGIPSI